MTLLASLLLERRVILVAPQADTVSAAVHAAAALLYPFTWQHIYLPLLPVSLKVCAVLLCYAVPSCVAVFKGAGSVAKSSMSALADEVFIFVATQQGKLIMLKAPHALLFCLKSG